MGCYPAPCIAAVAKDASPEGLERTPWLRLSYAGYLAWLLVLRCGSRSAVQQRAVAEATRWPHVV